jgi:V-type H+-transporting ATPase subunit H
VGALAKILRAPAVRTAAVAAGLPSLLPPVLRKAAASAAPQAAYDASIAAWLTALTPSGASALEAAGAVAPLVDVLRSAAKEKVVRAAALALGAMMGAPAPTGPAAGGAAVAAGAARAVDGLLAQTWEDADVAAALEAVRDAVAAAADAAASWDAYRAEVLSGRLAWTPAHTSPAFWAAHAPRLEDRDAQVLRVLVRLLDGAAAGGDARTLAVACSDLAAYAGAVPHGRGVLTSIGAKEAAVRLLAHADDDVRRHALAAVQGLVLSRERLQFLNAGG